MRVTFASSCSPPPTKTAAPFGSVADGTALFVVDVTDPAAPEFGVNRSRSFDYTSGHGKYVCQNALTLSNRMTDPLEPGHTYAAWVSTAVRSEGGGTPVQDPDLVAVLADTPPADASLMPAWQKHANFRAYLARAGKTAAARLPAACYGRFGTMRGLLENRRWERELIERGAAGTSHDGE